ncbi:MAG: bifunctional adenosylcobinamide kinase/adenosylcobinamide-phosphate guanylyltransferase [Rhodobacteraceae bacterium]|nr:bifunctional adenosylcobinamide kinase/adenosylcobinamide-phosphate guanylyltransferase [Paracoccaceae bacterium]MCY4197873.1 bifunctional adenosylcobinamide kinase/adenosylcobinamide-phosphate guanylyltransferase [Paracoccaceae bacterium]MCY4325964.1 bifunctional adenosylcobinamide kinase/adenosylcobinamide-phosphate guanylyltransferase [Paracoccaceae bacterium]
MVAKLVLVLGGASCGKTALAQQMTERWGESPAYIATAEPFDPEMKEKIHRHRATRGDNWITIEEPLKIAEILQDQGDWNAVLIDCLTMWVMNLIIADTDVTNATVNLIDAAIGCPVPVVMVSGETGMGIVPSGKLSRQFSQELGQVNQLIASQANLVILTVAGLPIALKGSIPECLQSTM